MNDEANTTQREKRHAVIYFSPKNSKAYKELAARVRSDGGRTTLVWSNQWKGAESILTECRGVIIERNCKNADDIVEAYRRYAVDVEIHYTDENGEFSEDGEAEEETITEEPVTAEEPPITEETVTEPESGATEDEEEHVDPDTTSDAVVEEAEAEDGDASTDPDSDSEDAGTADDSGEAGAEKPTDSS